jgi:hypothetical protein
MSKLKLAVGVLAAVGMGTTLMLEHRALTQLRQENQTLEQQIARLTAQVESQSRAPDAKTLAPQPSSLRDQQLKELQRLRGEVGSLRPQSNDLASLRATNRDLRTATDEPDDPAEAEFKEQTRMRIEHLKQWGLSFILYAQAHQGQFPESFEQAAKVQNSEALLEFDTNHFAIVYRGSQESVVDPGQTIIFREKQARCAPNGEWSKVYGLADGSVQVHTEPDEANFAAWEKERVVMPR